MNGKGSLIIAVLILLITATFGMIYYYNINPTNNRSNVSLSNFNTLDDIENYILTHTVNYNIYSVLGYEGVKAGAVRPTFYGTTQSRTPSTGENTPQYSLTNVQVEGIDEADFVKTDGKYIYLVSRDRLYIVKAYPPNNLSITSSIEIPNYTINGIYVYMKKIVLITQKNSFIRILISASPGRGVVKSIAYVKPLSSILIYDISEPTKPTLQKNISFTGWISDSRLMNGILYSVIKEETLVRGKNVTLPSYYIDGEEYVVKPSEIYYTDYKDYGFQYTVIFTIELDSFEYNLLTILTGHTNILYMSYSSIYLTQTKWSMIPLNEYKGETSTVTKIFKFKVNGLKIKPYAVGEVKGFINNRLQLDEYKGFLRVSTYVWSWERMNNGRILSKSSTNIFVLDDNMKIVGSLEGISKSEVLYATRFMGDYAYLVTFRRIDPLFIIDLSNPYNPKIVGKLKIPGFSSMLQPIWDNLIIGIGYEQDNQTRILRLKVSLFDVSEPSHPKEIGKIVYNESEWGWSQASYDIHAILKIPKYKYVGIPVEYYNSKLVNAYLLMKADKNGLQKISLIKINLQENGNIPLKSYWIMYMRGIYIGKYLYIVTNNGILAYDLENLTEVNNLIINS